MIAVKDTGRPVVIIRRVDQVDGAVVRGAVAPSGVPLRCDECPDTDNTVRNSGRNVVRAQLRRSHNHALARQQTEGLGFLHRADVKIHVIQPRPGA